jgi:hypothetical protein
MIMSDVFHADLFPSVGNVRHSQVGRSVGAKRHQRLIRERVAGESPRPQIERLENARVIEVPTHTARPIIYRYEWLGTMGRSVHCCGLFMGRELLGVVCFGWPASPESRDICGREHREQAIAIERGACVHYAPKNAGSFLVANACKLIAQNHGYRIFYAYSDEDAGEIGTIYQACNWKYIGQGVGRTPGRLREYYKTPEGKVVSCRTLRHRKLTKTQALAEGWEIRYQQPKHKYVHFEGSKTERKNLLRELRYPVLPYPKRDFS